MSDAPGQDDTWDVEVEPGGQFVQVPYWVDDADLSDRALRLYVKLRRKGDYRTGRVYGGRKRFAEMVKCSESTLDRAMAELERVGAVVVKRTYDTAAKQWRPNRYQVRHTQPATCPTPGGTPTSGTPPCPTSGTPCPTGDDAFLDPEYFVDPRTNTPAAAESALTEQLDGQLSFVADGDGAGAAAQPDTKPKLSRMDREFADFWSYYPRKIDKRRARSAFATAVSRIPGGLDALDDTMALGLGRWLAHWKAARTPLDKIPHPVTWLNNDRWEAAPPRRHTA